MSPHRKPEKIEELELKLQLRCCSLNLRIKRYDALCDTIFHTLLQDHSGIRREQHCAGYTTSRPGEVYHPDFLLGRPAYFDITIRNSFQLFYVVQSAQYESATAAAGEIEKDERHLNNVETVGGLFYPLVVESYTVCGPPTACKTTARRTSFGVMSLLAELLLTCMDGSLSVFGSLMLGWSWTVCPC